MTPPQGAGDGGAGGAVQQGVRDRGGEEGEANGVLSDLVPAEEPADAGGPDGGGPDGRKPEQAALSPQELMKEIASDPIIRRANELFGAGLDHGEQER